MVHSISGLAVKLCIHNMPQLMQLLVQRQGSQMVKSDVNFLINVTRFKRQDDFLAIFFSQRDAACAKSTASARVIPVRHEQRGIRVAYAELTK
jgi:hypothetical protein